MAPEEQASAPAVAAHERSLGTSNDDITTTTTAADPGHKTPGSEKAAEPADAEAKTDGSQHSQRRMSNSGSEKGKPAFANVDSSDDENTVFWDNDDDPHNPYNWPTWLKVVNCVLISTLTFVTPLASCKSGPRNLSMASQAFSLTRFCSLSPLF